jgi:hypothetical protein
MECKSKRVYQRLLLALIAAVLVGITALSTVWAQIEPIHVLRQYQFKKMKGITIHVLKREIFQQRFGDNLEIPRTNEDVIQLARRLYSAAGRAEIKERCAEHIYGALFAALTNPDISDEARDAVDKEAYDGTPSLPQTYTSGHFKFYYTTNDGNPDNNVTLADIQATATVLNKAWNNYVTNFTKPMHYNSAGMELIDVNVYNLGGTLYGSTASHQNYIDLCSKKTVKNACLRQSVPVHELFHRVQYSYGYITGTANMSWAVEATAGWSQKYLASNVGDWMGWWMNDGFNMPDKDLITARSYDACHFWVYLGERGGGEKECIKLLWSTYQTNGNNMKSAAENVIRTRVTDLEVSSFDEFAVLWNCVNIRKDESNVGPKFDYTEDELTKTCGGVTYGPLVSVPRTTQALNVGTNYSTNSFAAAYGADYYVFNIGATVKKVEIGVTATSNNLGHGLIALKDNRELESHRSRGGGKNNYSYTKTITPGQFSQIVLVVIGCPGSCNYSVSAKGSQ